MNSEDLRSTEMPHDWDRLAEPPDSIATDEEVLESPVESGDPPILLLVAAAWGDLVCILAMSAAILGATVVSGYSVSAVSLLWMAALAICWWACSSAILVLIRRGTPGMLLAGVLFEVQVPPHRLSRVVLAASVLALLVGVPAIIGPRSSLLRLASGSPLCLA